MVSPLTRCRRAAERRFRLWGIASVALSLAMLGVMLVTILGDGVSAFRQARIEFPVTLDPAVLDPGGGGTRDSLARVTTLGYGRFLAAALTAHAAQAGILPDGMDEAAVGAMISRRAPAVLRDRMLGDPALLGQTITLRVLASGRIDGYLKGRETRESAARDLRLSGAQLDLADALMARGELFSAFNPEFLTAPDASDQRPEAAGLGVAIVGSLYMMVLVVALALPTGVAASIYLEEFAPRNRLTDLIEVNIANLAAVPSIVFGILGLAIFINLVGLPQSSPVVGALVLTLMTLPTVIIATRAAIRAVPPSIRDAALGVGASRMQAVFHHVLPLAMPGILTGAILGLATSLGETAPLLLIGMVAFVHNMPDAPVAGFLDPATALPVQVYSWVQRSDPAFVERASGAIIVLLFFLLIMNLGAVILRRRFERRW
ncbi:MAG: phosphate ABC transporter permease PstA [Rubellimicrobium sp.]|nr:phosphate ABC transporter permease PstA [Rubellimicrobium sp.]